MLVVARPSRRLSCRQPACTPEPHDAGATTDYGTDAVAWFEYALSMLLASTAVVT